MLTNTGNNILLSNIRTLSFTRFCVLLQKKKPTYRNKQRNVTNFSRKYKPIKQLKILNGEILVKVEKNTGRNVLFQTFY